MSSLCVRKSFVKNIAEIVWYRLKSIFLLLYFTRGVALCEARRYNDIWSLEWVYGRWDGFLGGA